MEGWDNYLIYNSQENIFRKTPFESDKCHYENSRLQWAHVKILNKLTVTQNRILLLRGSQLVTYLDFFTAHNPKDTGR